MTTLALNRNLTTAGIDWQFIKKQPQKSVVYPTHTTPYHRPTLAKSIEKTCLKAFGYSGEAKLTSAKVCEEVEAWLEDKVEVTSGDIRRQAAAALHKYNPRAAYLYLPCKQYAYHEDAYGIVQL